MKNIFCCKHWAAGLMAAAILIATPVHCGYWSAEAEKALREDMKAPTL